MITLFENYSPGYLPPADHINTLPPVGAMPYPCPQRCPARRRLRICGSDGNTYDSICHMRMEACRTGDRSLVVNHLGTCQCPEVCLMVYDPVCATSSRPAFGEGVGERTYTSRCEMLKDACRNNDQTFAVSHAGECASTIPGKTNTIITKAHQFQNDKVVISILVFLNVFKLEI